MLTIAVLALIDWGVIAVYLLGVLGIGAFVSRRQSDSDDFFLASRSMPVWAVSLSIVATTLSAATFMGAPQLAYKNDLSYMILNVGQILAAFIAAFIFVPIFYRAGTTTIYGYLGQRFGPGAMIAGSSAFLIGRLLASGARLFMAGIVFSLMLYGDAEKQHLIPAIILFGVVGTAYTVFGGIRAVIWTDVMQITIVIGAAVVSMVLLLNKIPLSIAEIGAALGDEVSSIGGHSKMQLIDWSFDLSKPYTVWTGVIAATVFNLGWYATDHDLVQRVVSCKTPWHGSLSLIASLVVGVPVTLLFMCIGLLLYIFYARPDLMGGAAPAYGLGDTSKVYPLFLLKELPPGMVGLAMAGLFAVAMGSLDSAVNAMAASALSDLVTPWRKLRGEGNSDDRPLRAPRIAVAITGAALVGVALLTVAVYDPTRDTLIDFALGVMAFAWAGLVGVFLAAAFTRRGNTSSVVLALLSGAVTVALLRFALPAVTHALAARQAAGQGAEAVKAFELAWPWQMVVATALSFTVCVLGRPGKQPPHAADNAPMVLATLASQEAEK